MNKKKTKLLRITTVPISLKLLLTGQMRFMSSNGFELKMISADGNEIPSICETENCPHEVVPFSRKITPILDLYCLLKLIFLFKKEKPVIVHTHTPKAGLLGMLAGKICSVPLRIHTVAGLPLMTAKGGKRKLLEQIEKLTYWAAHYVLPNSQSILSFVKKKQMTASHKLLVIGQGSSNGIDLKRYSNTAIKKSVLDKLKKEINYDADTFYLLAVGRVVKDKGIIELIEAFLQIKLKHEKIKLILLGPLEMERAEELLPENILTIIKEVESIIHINWSDEVAYYMQLADGFIHASHREGFPNVLLQAGAMKCPIICSTIPGNVDIVQDNKTGLHFEVKNVQNLCEKINYLLNNYQEAQARALVLRKEIEANYSREFIHQELLKFYNSKLSEQ